ncbi:AP2/B3-like transcriptional factor family protein [Striga asiatica]|uniref:AP2/B3-like transcriptional factor family protein n=1 Tax=Striga asiatica TaxID=4170 RepID=A0A5A7P7H9_STRAF|nr:AP2/B3-like transcriptional factor family protein [Striga asiatica]
MDNDVMKKVFGFNLIGKRSKPADFNAKTSWKELSPDTTWDSRGMPNNLVQDLATMVVQRFIAYNITGKKEANKLSETELYLVALGKRGIPALGHVVTALAKHFGIPD